VRQYNPEFQGTYYNLILMERYFKPIPDIANEIDSLMKKYPEQHLLWNALKSSFGGNRHSENPN
jgi:hypothetical protein